MRTRTLLVLAVVVGLVASVLVGPESAGGKPSTSFPSGRWKGVGVLTGGIASDGVKASIASPGTFNFEVEVGADGEVVDGSWTLSGLSVNSVVPGGSGAVSFTGSGPLGGTANRVTLEGTISLGGTVSVQGITVDVSSILGSLPASGGFSPTFTTCTSVSGDIATEARQAQVASGFSTSVTGPFTAQRIAKAGDNLAPGFDETYVNLVDAVEKLSLEATPSAVEVVALVEQVDAFYAQVYGASKCPGGPKNLAKGKQPYTYFVEKLAELLSNALDNPNAYSPSELQSLILSAVHLGVIGSAAPDSQLAGEITGKFADALEAKIADAKAGGDTTGCVILFLAATAGGYASIAQDAKACSS